MAGGFTSPKSSPPQMRHGKGRPGGNGIQQKAKPEYPITDSFASKTIESFPSRRRKNNNKSGWNVKPSKPAGRGF